MSTPEQQRRATEFLERLLADPQLRAEFRRRPATTCREHDLPELAEELDVGVRGTATLEQRESRSGMAGVMIAAAAEGVGLVELLARHAVQMGDATAATASQLVERVTSGSGHAGSATAAAEPAASDAGAAAASHAPVASAAEPAAMPADGVAAAGAPAVAFASADPAGLPAAGGAAPMTAAAAAAPPAAQDPAGLPPALPATVQAPPVAGAAPVAAEAAATSAASPPAGAPAGAAEQTASAATERPQQEPGQGRGRSPVDSLAPKHEPAAPNDTAAAPPTPPAEAVAAAVEAGQQAAGAYPGDGAPKEQLAAWMGRRAAASGLPQELPVMAALVESGLANLAGGDRDSVGFFQMRLSIWDQGAYSGYPSDPNLQLQWFIDQAAAQKARRIAAGDANFGVDPSSWGEWVADVENPDRRFRHRYIEQLDAARDLLAAGGAGADGAAATATAAGVAAPPAPATPVSATALAQDARSIDPSAAVAAVAPAADRALALARTFLGDAYVWGGASPQTGFDCSGLVQYVYQQAGIELPRVTHEQFAVGQVVGRGELRSGDIVFFRDATGYIHHEGLYLGDGTFLHAPSTGDVIKISSLDEPYYAQQFAGGRRVSAPGSAILEQQLDMTRRSAGHVAAARAHDARVLPVLDPSAPRPAG